MKGKGSRFRLAQRNPAFHPAANCCLHLLKLTCSVIKFCCIITNYWFTVGFALHLVWLCGKLDHYHLVVSISSNNQGSILYHCCCYHYVVITIVVMITFFFSECIYCCHIIVTSCYYMIFFLALFPPQFPIFGGLSPWKIPAMILRSSWRSSICSENCSHIFSYVPVWFSTDFSIFSPYFSHIFPYSSTSIPNVNHQHRAPTSPSYRRWCPRSFWRTAWSLANVRRVLGKMMVGTKVTKICINHRLTDIHNQSDTYIYIYIYDMCIRVCIYYIYTYI